MYDVNSCQLKKTLIGHKSRILGCFLNPFSEYQLYSYSFDGEIRLWDTEDGGCLKVVTIEGYQAFCQVVVDPTSPDTLFIAAVYKEDIQTRFWRVFSYNIRTKRITRKIIIGMNGVVHLASRAIDPSYTPETWSDKRYSCGSFLAITHGHRLLIYNTITDIVTVFNHAYDFYGLTIHPQRALVLTSDSKGSMQQWFVLQKTGTPADLQEQLAQANLQGTEVAWLRRSAELPPTIVSDSHPTMGVSLHWHPHPFTSILAPAHSDLVLTGGEEGVVVLWYPNSQQPGFIPRVAPAITHMAVSADGVRLVVCGNDNALRFVEVSQKKVRVAITGLGLGALPSTAPIARIARAGLAFDQRSQELLVAMPGNSALLQRYDAVRDRQCGVVGEVRVETARTRHHDARGFRRVDLQALSMNYDWLFTLERWATPSGPHQLTLKSYRRGGDGGWSLFAEIANPHRDRILCLAVHPCKNEVITTDGAGLVKVWRLVEKTSPLNNNEAVSFDATHTWTCGVSFVPSEEPCAGISFSADGSVYALAHPRSVSLWTADSHRLLRVLPSPPPFGLLRGIAFLRNGAELLVATEHALFLWDVITGQTLWLLHAEIHAIASSQYNPLDEPLIVAAVQNEERPESDSLLFFRPESATPVASVTLNTKVWALAYGREGARQGRRRCVFAMTEKKEIVKVVEGEVKETTEATEEEMTISAFDEVFDVDQVEKEAENLRKGRDYNDLLKTKDFYAMLNGPTHMLPPPSVLFQSFFDKAADRKSVV